MSEIEQQGSDSLAVQDIQDTDTQIEDPKPEGDGQTPESIPRAFSFWLAFLSIMLAMFVSAMDVVGITNLDIISVS